MITTTLLLALAFAQQDGWTDTHRLVLRNGNFLDGVIESLEEDLVTMKCGPTAKVFISVSEIQKDDKGRPQILEIRIRHADAEAKVIAPPTSTPTPTPGTERRDPLTTPGPTPSGMKARSAEPLIDPAKKERLDKILTALSASELFENTTLKQETAKVGPVLIPWLIWRMETLPDEHITVVFDAFRQFRDTPFDDQLVAILRSPQAAVRAGSAQLLMAREARSSVSSIVPLLRDSDPFVKTSAAQAISAMGDAESLQSLQELVFDPNTNARQTGSGCARTLARKVGQVGPFTKFVLDGAVSSSSDAIRADAIVLLNNLASETPRAADFPTDGVRDFFMNALTDPQEAVRAQGARALVNFKSPELAKRLLELLATESAPSVSAGICATLGAIGTSEVVLPLIKLLQSDAPSQVKSAASGALRHVTKQTSFGEDGAKWQEWYDATTK